MTASEAVVFIKNCLPNRKNMPLDYLQGYCTLTFSALAAWKGYEEAVREVEFLINRDVCPGCKLITTYQAFRAAEAEMGELVHPRRARCTLRGRGCGVI